MRARKRGAKVSPEYREWMERRKDLVATMNDAKQRDLSRIPKYKGEKSSHWDRGDGPKRVKRGGSW